MRHGIIMVTLLLGCGDGPREPADLSAPPPIDLAQPSPAPVVDLAQPPPPPPPVDMARPPACTAPLPGVYSDYLQFTYAPLSNPSQVAGAQDVTTAIVRNDGTLIRPSPAISTPQGYHCDFTLASVDPETCMAPCCVGQPGTPTFYFDAKGWVLAVSGVCQFQTSSAVSYSATIVDGNGSLVH